MLDICRSNQVKFITLISTVVICLKADSYHFLNQDCKHIEGTNIRRLIFELNGTVLYSHPRYAEIVDQLNLRTQALPTIRPNLVTNYPTNFTCEVYIKASGNSHIMIRFHSLYIPSKESLCDENYMYIFDSNTPQYRAMASAGGEQGLCGQHFPLEPLFTTQSFLTIVFKSTIQDSQTVPGIEPGFKLTLTAVQNAIGVGVCQDKNSFYCGQLESKAPEKRRLPRQSATKNTALSVQGVTRYPRYSTESGYCIPKGLQCDGIVHCHNARDELPSLSFGKAKLPPSLLRMLVRASLIPEDLKSVGCTAYAFGGTSLSRDHIEPTKLNEKSTQSDAKEIEDTFRIPSILIIGCTCIALFFLLVCLCLMYQSYLPNRLRAQTIFQSKYISQDSKWAIPYTQYVYPRAQVKRAMKSVTFDHLSLVLQSDTSDKHALGVKRSTTIGALAPGLTSTSQAEQLPEGCHAENILGCNYLINQRGEPICGSSNQDHPVYRKNTDHASVQVALYTGRTPNPMTMNFTKPQIGILLETRNFKHWPIEEQELGTRTGLWKNRTSQIYSLQPISNATDQMQCQLPPPPPPYPEANTRYQIRSPIEDGQQVISGPCLKKFARRKVDIKDYQIQNAIKMTKPNQASQHSVKGCYNAENTRNTDQQSRTYNRSRRHHRRSRENQLRWVRSSCQSENTRSKSPSINLTKREGTNMELGNRHSDYKNHGRRKFHSMTDLPNV